MSDLLEPDHEPCTLDPAEHDCESSPEECEGEPKWWTCRYYQTVERTDGRPAEMCSFGCHDEPNCVTGQPTEGWQTEPSDA